MQDSKITLHHFAPEAFDEEMGRLDELSRQGWQLEKLGTFCQRFRREDGVSYRYAVDFNRQEFTLQEFQDYRALFQDDSWEYVTRKGSCFVFRKRFDPALPEEAYVIYTDEASLAQMKKSIRLPWELGSSCILLYLALLSPSAANLLLLAACLLLILYTQLRRRRLKKARPTAAWQKRSWLNAVPLLLSLLLIAASLVYILSADAFHDLYAGPAADSASIEFTKKLPDLCSLYITSDGSADEPFLPAAFTLTDGSGAVVCSGTFTADSTHADLFLPAGAYTLCLDWQAALPPDSGTSPTGGEYTVYLGPHSSFLIS